MSSTAPVMDPDKQHAGVVKDNLSKILPYIVNAVEKLADVTGSFSNIFLRSLFGQPGTCPHSFFQSYDARS